MVRNVGVISLNIEMKHSKMVDLYLICGVCHFWTHCQNISGVLSINIVDMVSQCCTQLMFSTFYAVHEDCKNLYLSFSFSGMVKTRKI